ncbi:MAG: hypothetical protein ACR2QV_12220 [Gammaproteobacteria bacterium]
MKATISMLLAAVFAASPAIAAKWDLRDESIGLALADAEKTRDRDFEGTKLIADGRYVIRSEASEATGNRKCCTLPSRPDYFYGLLDGILQWGFDDTDLEFVRVGVTPWAVTWEPETTSPRKLRAKRDILELGAITWSVDDPLEVDSYLEIAIGRAGRLGELKWSESSPFTVLLGVQASIGFSWAESSDPQYSRVSNPFAGIHYLIALEHDRFGRLYADNRFVNGFSFSSPERGHPTVREANVRLGYEKRLSGCLALDLWLGKRSFNFEESGLPGRYTKAGTFAARVACRFSRSR